jgi:hypothetical protein
MTPAQKTGLVTVSVVALSVPFLVFGTAVSRHWWLAVLWPVVLCVAVFVSAGVVLARGALASRSISRERPPGRLRLPPGTERTPVGLPVDQLLLKPQALHLFDTYFACGLGIAGAIYTLVAATGSQKLWAIGFPAVFVGVLAYSLRMTRIAVTPDKVIVHDASMPVQRAPRAKVASVHRHSYWIVLRDEDDRRLLQTRRVWTRSQLNALADALGVSYIDHVKGQGLRGHLLS